MKPPRVIVTVGEDDFGKAGAQWIAQHVRESRAARGHCSIALAGGETPRIVYQCLAHPDNATEIPWSKIDFYFGDERCVPMDHPESNFRMAQESMRLVDRATPARVHRMPADRQDADLGAREYERLLPESLDVLLLGMGQDGHTASIFPGSSAIHERDRRVLLVASPKPPALRLTITPLVIETSKNILVMVRGKQKAKVIARVLSTPVCPMELPVQLAQGATFLLDTDAASELDQDTRRFVV